jgi:hypothetical protein
MIKDMESDPTLSEPVGRRLAQYRDQSEGIFSQLLEEDFKKSASRSSGIPSNTELLNSAKD